MKLLERKIYQAFIWLLLILSLPLLGLISLLILLTSGKPIIYSQKRIGYKGKIFTLFKFRTMQQNADSQKQKLLKQNEAEFPVFKIFNDPRFTQIGKFLSHTGIDELPQLVNVLKGEMALLGPRPLPVGEANKLKKWQQKRQQIKPGIISPWIINGYHNQSFSQWMSSDIDYINKKNLVYDTRLMFKTINLLAKLFIKEVLTLFS